MFKTNVQYNEQSQSKHLHNYLLGQEIEFFLALQNPSALVSPSSLRILLSPPLYYSDIFDGHFLTFLQSLLNRYAIQYKLHYTVEFHLLNLR